MRKGKPLNNHLEMLNCCIEKVSDCPQEESIERIIKLSQNQPLHVVTANPEIMMQAQHNVALKNVFKDPATLVVADGVGVVWAIKKVKHKKVPLTPGVDLVEQLLQNFCDSNVEDVDKGGTVSCAKKKIFLYGAQQTVLDNFVKYLQDKYPQVEIVGAFDGFSSVPSLVAKEIIAQKPDAVLVALGSPRQDEFICQVIERVKHGVFIGVGGTFDTLSGHVKRAPQVFRKLKIEWVYRTVRKPQRVGRLLRSHIPFVVKVLMLAGVNRLSPRNEQQIFLETDTTS